MLVRGSGFQIHKSQVANHNSAFVAAAAMVSSRARASVSKVPPGYFSRYAFSSAGLLVARTDSQNSASWLASAFATGRDGLAAACRRLALAPDVGQDSGQGTHAE